MASQATSNANLLNARLDSSLTNDPSRRGSLTPEELDSIHQSESFKQAKHLEKEDNQEIVAKMNQMQHAKQGQGKA